jgi:hypothetical protein
MTFMKHKNGVLMKNVIILSALVFFTGVKAFSQTGISVAPPRLYFEKKQGESHTHDVTGRQPGRLGIRPERRQCNAPGRNAGHLLCRMGQYQGK